MSSTNKRMTDLFIPIGRPRSSTSSVMTESSANTAAASAAIQSASTTPTTTSSMKSAGASNFQKTDSRSSSRTRYVISASSRDANLRAEEPLAGSFSDDNPSSSVHIRRQGRKLSAPISPIEQLTMRLSRVTGNGAKDVESYQHQDLTPPNFTAPGRPSVDASNIRGAESTPLTLPECTPAQARVSGIQRSQSLRSSIDSSMKHCTISNFRPDVLTAELPSPTRTGALSRSSSRSDRSFPPTSFPQDFSDKVIFHRVAHKSLFRSQSTKSSSSNASSRSVSPLKFEIKGPKTGNAGSALREAQQSSPQTPPSGSARDRSASKNDNSQLEENQDPSPFHRTIHHYTSCSHTAPPATRPLDVQPTLDETCQPNRSMISGSCFECDTENRRDMESAILRSYNPRIAAHMEDLSTIITRLEGLSPVSPLSPIAATNNWNHASLGQSLAEANDQFDSLNDEDVGTKDRQGSYSSLVSEEEDGESVAIRIQALEDRITDLTLSRDLDVKQIWKGYTQRWGPGTLGVVKSPGAIRSIIGTPKSGLSSSRMSNQSEHSAHGTPLGRMKVDWIRDRQDEQDPRKELEEHFKV